MSLSLLCLHFPEFYSLPSLSRSRLTAVCVQILETWQLGGRVAPMCWHFWKDPSNSLPFTSPPCHRVWGKLQRFSEIEKKSAKKTPPPLLKYVQETWTIWPIWANQSLHKLERNFQHGNSKVKKKKKEGCIWKLRVKRKGSCVSDRDKGEEAPQRQIHAAASETLSPTICSVWNTLLLQCTTSGIPEYAMSETYPDILTNILPFMYS